MYQLVLDSSNKFLVVGLLKDRKVVDSVYYEAWQRQSEVMVQEIDNLLNKNKLTRNDLDAVAVGIGPGSYTGVRIAITIAKTIGYALKIKTYAKSSLFLLKDCKKPTICIYNARSGRSYFAVYEGNKQLVEECIKTNEEVLDYIKKHSSFAVNGDVTHLGFESGKYDVFSNFVDVLNCENLVENIFTLNQIYLNDLTKYFHL